MLTRMLAVFAALAVIGFAAVVAPSPAVAQTGGDSTATTTTTATATATATPTATPAPLESFALKPHIGDLRPRGLTRLGNKWYVGGFDTGYIHIFSDTGAYERRIRSKGNLASGVWMSEVIRGLTANGTKLVAVTNSSPLRVYEWTPQANETALPAPSSITSLTTPPGGGRYHANGIAHDGTNLWVAVSWANKHALLKLNDTGTTLSTA